MKERLTIYIRFILKSKFLLPPKKYYKKFQFYYFIQIKKPRIYFIRGFYTILQKVVVLPRFELRQTEPKTVVLPLHHRTKFRCKVTEIFLYCKILWSKMQSMAPSFATQNHFQNILMTRRSPATSVSTSSRVL